MFLLDTHVVSEIRKARSGKADHGVATWAASAPTAMLFVSAITVHELEHGVLLAERADPAKGLVLRAWLDGSVLPAFEGRLLDVDATVARRAARLHVPDPAPYRDAFIGATAIVHGLTMVTRNVEDFARFEGLDIINPWSG
jgi:predicted nucleic acid-binding protein